MLQIADRPATHRVTAALIAFVLFAGIVAVLTHDDGVGIGEGRLRASGTAKVTSSDGRSSMVSGTVALHAGDVVEAVTGTLVIDLPDGSQLEGRAASAGTPGTKVQLAHPTELLGGELLVSADHGTVVDAGGNAVTLASGGPAAMRMSRSLSVGAGVYRGRADFDSAGQTRPLPALRQVEAPVLGRPSAVEAVALRSDDPWDRRFLGEAIDLGTALTRLANGYSSQFAPGEGQSLGFYEQVAPDLAREPQLDASLLTSVVNPSGRAARTPGDVLVGLTIARLGTRGTFADRLGGVFAFADAGATWGLVALDQGVASAPLLQAVQAAVGATPFQFAQGAAVGGANRGSTTTAPAGTTPSTSSGTTATTSGGSSRGTPTTAPPTTSPPTTPTTPTLPPVTPPTTLVPPSGSPLVDGLVNDVNSTLNGVLPN